MTSEGIRWYLTGLLFQTSQMKCDLIQTTPDGLKTKGLRPPPPPAKNANPDYLKLSQEERKKLLIESVLKNTNEFLGTNVTWEPGDNEDFFKFNL